MSRTWLRVLPLVFFASFFAPKPSAFAGDPVESADKSAHDWMQFRIESARLKDDWRSQREIMESLVTGLQERAKTLEENRELAKAKAAHEQEEIADIRAKQQAATDDLKQSETRLKALSAQLLALRQRLPPRLSEALEMSYRTLASENLSASERMQVAMNVLNRSAQFNRLVSVGQDALTLPGEPPDKYYQVVYWGLSHGYAIDGISHRAWLGSPGPRGWQWEPQPGAYDSVVKLIAIASGKADPEYVAVPAVVAQALPAPTGK